MQQNSHPFRVTVRIRNNELLRRRGLMGLSQVALAKAAEIPVTTYQRLENLGISPVSVEEEDWIPAVKKLVDFYECEPEDLFPLELMGVVQNKVEREMSFEQIRAIAAGGENEQLLLSPVEAMFEATELKEQIGRVLDTLPSRKREVLCLVYGIRAPWGLAAKVETHERTDTEVAELLGITGGRVQQIRLGALRLLRHPSRSKRLKVFTEAGG